MRIADGGAVLNSNILGGLPKVMKGNTAEAKVSFKPFIQLELCWAGSKICAGLSLVWRAIFMPVKDEALLSLQAIIIL